ncbi:hypothetical protein [Demequina flava]|uniref:hypothetical protein n=1 Tax=Demequina flava TaxID=1095025 RepID=UPI001470821B|nr:hypothetical protein [Demequina flava]
MTGHDMTTLAPPPALDLPHGSLSLAVNALQDARDALAAAGDVQWVSLAADAYQERLTELTAKLTSLEDAVYAARAACWGAQSAADAAGQ